MVRPFRPDRDDGRTGEIADLAGTHRDLAGCSVPALTRAVSELTQGRPRALGRTFCARRWRGPGAAARQTLAPSPDVWSSDGSAWDPTAVACASRRAGEPWFVFEQPTAATRAFLRGSAWRWRSSQQGPRTAFGRRWPSAWRAPVGRRTVGEQPDGLGGRGVRFAMGGFAVRAPTGGAAGRIGRASRRPSLVVFPEVRLCERVQARRAAQACAPDAERRWLRPTTRPRICNGARLPRTASASCASAPLPLLDPAPAGRFQVASANAAGSISRARWHAPSKLIGAGELEKGRARARKCTLQRPPQAYDPAALLGGCCAREFPSCFVFCVGPRRRDAGRREPGALGCAARGHSREPRLALARPSTRLLGPTRQVDASTLGEQLFTRRELSRGARRIVRAGASSACCASTRIWVARRARAGARAHRQHPAPGHADFAPSLRRRSTPLELGLG